MRSYIFITTEGCTFQPNSTSPEPDIENCQVIGFGYGRNAKEAFETMIKENEYLLETTFDEVIGMELKSEGKICFYLNDYPRNTESNNEDDE